MTEINMPPSSQEAEDAILGAIIESPSLLDETTAYLSSDIFYYERSKRLYFILTEMHKNGDPIDTITIVGRLSTTDKVSGVTALYISGLKDSFGTPSLAKRYAIQVYEKHLLREVISQTNDISKSAYMNNQDV